MPGGLSATHTFRAQSCPLSFPLRLQAEAPQSCRCQQQKNAWLCTNLKHGDQWMWHRWPQWGRRAVLVALPLV